MSAGLDSILSTHTRGRWSTTIVDALPPAETYPELAFSLQLHRGSSLDPRFFLASVDRRVWIPRIAMVKSAGDVAGLVYLKERKLAGFATGVLYGDDTLESMVLADSAGREEVLAIALGSVLKRRGVRGLRLLASPRNTELEAIRSAADSSHFDFRCAAAENHCYVPLPPDYDLFLSQLGARTRRNFRYYRRRFEENGHCYVSRLALEEFAVAASGLCRKSVVGANREGIKRALDIFSVVKNPLLAGLRGGDGQWLSIIGGWYEAGHGMIFLQMNDDRDHAGDSLSAVMRSYVIEEMIAGRIRSIRFWAGTGGALFRYRVPIPTVRIQLDRRSVGWRATRAFLSGAVRPLFPKRLGWVADWMG